jgi:hypothetical protein
MGRPRLHAPDFFARRADCGGLVVDVRPDDRIPAKDAEVFRMTAMACRQAGWEFRRAGTIDPVVRANVRWLSRYGWMLLCVSGGGWLLTLLSRLPSGQRRSSGGKPTRTTGPPGPGTGSGAAA